MEQDREAESKEITELDESGGEERRARNLRGKARFLLTICRNNRRGSSVKIQKFS